MKHKKIAVIGAGFIGKQHIEAIRRIPYAHVEWVADSGPETARRTAEMLGVPRWSPDYRDVLNDETVSAVHICTPSGSHFEIGMQALSAGKHLYCEKPLALTVTDALALLALARERGLAHGVNFNYRHNVMVREMRQRVRGGSLGTLLSVSGRYLQDWLLYRTDYDWRMDPAVGGPSRALADIGSHCFDTAQFVLGEKIRAVYAKCVTCYPTRMRRDAPAETFGGGTGEGGREVPVTSEDMAYVLAAFEDGLTGSFQFSQVCAGKKNDLALRLSGSQASLEWEQERCDVLKVGRRDRANEMLCAAPVLLSQSAAQGTTLPGGHAPGWHDALRNAISSFYEAVDENSWESPARTFANFADAIEVMRIVDACLRSDRTGSWVKIEDTQEKG